MLPPSLRGVLSRECSVRDTAHMMLGFPRVHDRADNSAFFYVALSCMEHPVLPGAALWSWCTRERGLDDTPNRCCRHRIALAHRGLRCLARERCLSDGALRVVTGLNGCAHVRACSRPTVPPAAPHPPPTIQPCDPRPRPYPGHLRRTSHDGGACGCTDAGLLAPC